MVDLNLWQLAYDDTVLEFGTHESGHPFTKQVEVSMVELDTDDLPHPMSDSVVFGRDYSRGFALGFAGAHLSTLPQAVGVNGYVPPGKQWSRPMDDAQTFERSWRARAVREVPGKVATLTNVDRGRFVYGRPRPFVPGHEKVRYGWLTYGCVFVTSDDKFYSTTEKVIVAGVDPGSVGAFTFPMTFPHSGVAPTESRAWVINDGTDDTWPTITFRRGGYPRLELLNDAGGVEWALKVNDTLAYDDEVTIDCRPWIREVRRNGALGSGLVRGSKLDAARIPAGTHELRLVAEDPTGLAEVEVRWRDAYGSL